MSKIKLAKILSNKEKIVKLLNENIDLNYQVNYSTYKSFSEKEINVGTKKQPINRKVKIGHWISCHHDLDRPNEKPIQIPREDIVEVDGEKSIGWSVLKYYSIDSI